MQVEKQKIKRVAKRIGLDVRGNFLFGCQTEDVISGLAIDSAPASTYIWTFVLPCFDRLEFLHMTLGDRVVDLSRFDGPVELALQKALATLPRLSTASDLLTYLESRNYKNDYALWVKFLCYVRTGQFEDAEKLSRLFAEAASDSTRTKFAELEGARLESGWEGAQAVLSEWSAATAHCLSGAESRN